MISPDSEEYRLLYTDELGEDVGLDEVQLLDPPPEDRVPLLSKMLESANIYLSYQAALVLTAWGKNIGVARLEQLIDGEKISGFGFSPNRLSSEDNVYDELSYAVHLYGLSGGERSRMLRIFDKLLKIYPKYFFESKLKHSLLKNPFKELVTSVEEALQKTLINGRVYQASQLLPVLAKLDQGKGWSAIRKFDRHEKMVPDPTVNVAEALRYCSPTQEVIYLLTALKADENKVVSSEAEKSLQHMTI